MGANCLFKLLSGSICFKSDQASTLHHRAPPHRPFRPGLPQGSGACTFPQAAWPRFSEPTPPVRCKEHTLDRNLRGERQEGDELTVGEVRPVDSVSITRGSSSLFYSKIIQSPSKEMTRSLELRPGHRLWAIPGSFAGQDQG